MERFFKFRSQYSPQDDRIDFLKRRIPLKLPEPEPVSLDLTQDGERHLVLAGCRSGKGNPHFVSQEIRGPPFALRGEPGREITLEFELKSLADAGASSGAGLGHSFLRHIERSKIIVYVIDLSGNSPWKDLQILKNELENYKKGLSLRPCLVLANKAEMSGARNNLAVLSSHFPDDTIIPISAKNHTNISLATKIMRRMNEG
ncbi:MAG: hypothetical protein SGCHY_005644 [Lobulomycetales sp.]